MKKVTIYPSNFGLERMKYEEEHGPKFFDELSQKNVSVPERKENEELDEFSEELLRKYELSKLRYAIQLEEG